MNALATTLYIQDLVNRFDPQTAHISFLGIYFNHKSDSRIDKIRMVGDKILDERWQNDKVHRLSIKA